MWPFNQTPKAEVVPAIQCGDVLVTWDSQFKQWEFLVNDIEYTFYKPIFNPEVFAKLGEVETWLAELGPAIDKEIAPHLAGWKWDGKKDLVAIEVAELVEKGVIDVSYAEEEWADLGVNIIIVNGRIKESYAGD